MTQTIPKVIHYCWFGHKKKSTLINKCISSWHAALGAYVITEWNENNFDISHCLFASQAHQARKYAFVADYVRASVLYRFGGIYMDTDVEILKCFPDSMLAVAAFAGCEKIGRISAGIIGSRAEHCWIKEIKEYYENIPFMKANGAPDLTPIPNVITNLSYKLGFKDVDDHQHLTGDVHIYPVDFFYPKSWDTQILTLTSNSIAIHHFAESWIPLRAKIVNTIRRLPTQLLSRPFLL